MDQSILSNQDSRSRGFTLVELAIVLVIVGLLIGGILAAQSMIETARLNSQIRQLQQLDMTTQNFYSKFRRLPGDADKDGILEDGPYNPSSNDAPCAHLAVTYGECWNFFVELSALEQLRGNYLAPTSGLLFGPGKYGPLAEIGRSGIIGTQNSRLEMFWTIGVSKDFVIGGTRKVNAFTPVQALSLERKLDDGNGYTGNIATIGTTWGTDVNLASFGACADENCYAVVLDNNWSSTGCVDHGTGAYIMTDKKADCGLQFKANISK